MCGIFGAIHRAGYFDEQDHARFVACTHLADHRGPDGFGTVALDGKAGRVGSPGRFDVFLGHLRLAIIDLRECANEPMSQDDDTLWITFNGEIYNYVELRAALRKEHGYPFKTDGDTEVILGQYSKYGADGFQALNGMWALALADLRKRQVILSRDRFSEKPLYYFERDDYLYFASEIKQLLPLVSTPEPDRRTIAVFLRQGLLDCGPATFFRGITRVRAKHNLFVPLDGGPIRETPYWDYTVREDRRPIDETAAEFRELLTDAIRIRLRSDVKVGTLLSGGLDSSTIAVVGNRLSGGNLESYSVVSRDERYSEGRFIDAVAGATGLPNRKLTFDVGDVLANLEAVLHHNDEPPGGFSAVAHYEMMRVIKSETDVTVLLSGQGGDELLLGYRKFYFFYLRDLLRRGSLLTAGRELVGSLVNRTTLWQFDVGEARRYLPRRWQNGADYLRGTADVEDVSGGASLSARQMADLDRFSVPNLTHYEDRNSMAFALEIRLPFLDHRLADFALSIPADQKVRNGWSKYILRTAFPELPPAIRWRRDKQGFILPEARWLRNDLADVIRSTFAGSVLGDLGVLEPRAFLRYYDEFRSGKQVWYNDISRVFMAELWARQRLVTPPFAAGNRSPRKTADCHSPRSSLSRAQPS
jgi:asparagine synthase (glutamine-hydrolysing)